MPRPKTVRVSPSLDALFGGAQLDGSGDTPKYHQLEHLLRRCITTGVLQPGDGMPTEKELVQHFSVSRVTVRSALQQLTTEGLLDRCRGRGTVVRPPKVEVRLLRPGSFTETFRSLGYEVESEIVGDQVVVAPEAVAKGLGMPEGTRVWCLERVRSLNAERIALFTHYLDVSLRPPSLSAVGGSLYQYLASLGQRPSHWRSSLEAVRAEAPVHGLLQVPLGTPLLRRYGVGLLDDGATVEYSVCHYRGDRYRYCFES